MYTFTHLQSISQKFDTAALYEKLLQNEQYSYLFESAEYHAEKGRYTFMGIAAERIFTAPARSTQNFFEKFKLEILRLQKEFGNKGRFPYAPGLFGYISFEAARFIERVTMHESQSTIPDALFFLPSLSIVIDHTENTLTLFATTHELLQKGIHCISDTNASPHVTPGVKTLLDFSIENIPLETHTSFICSFHKAKELIAQGDLMQLVISQQLTKETNKSPFELYTILKHISPSPYQYILTFPEFSIVGCSPETLVRVENNEVITRPIAGTRRRGSTKQEDDQLAQELVADEKERAEHAMLVDLGRNDLGKVCKSGSVTVQSICAVEKFSTVMHLVSEVRGALSPTKDCVDAFMACFPAGTLSGAPKKRALERIVELENTPRGIYGGAVGYIDCAGSMDFAIAIRTILHTGTSVLLQAGAGIVADSQPQKEDDECRNKIKAPYASVIA